MMKPDLSHTVCTGSVLTTQLFLLYLLSYFRRPSWREVRPSGWPRLRTLRPSAAWLWRGRWWKGWSRVKALVDSSLSRPWLRETGTRTTTYFLSLSAEFWASHWTLGRRCIFTLLPVAAFPAPLQHIQHILWLPQQLHMWTSLQL